MAGLIRLLSTSTVRPASGDRHRDVNRRIELTPSDIQFLSFQYSHRGLLFNKPKENPVEHLKATLSLALDHFYPLAGRLVLTQHDGQSKTVSFHVECSGAGAMFVHAEAVDTITVADILNPRIVPREIVKSFYSLTEFLSNQAAGSDLPLLAVQVTEITDGVYVGVSSNHGVADGTTFYDFINVWSELTRGDSAATSQRGGYDFGRECFDGLVEFPIRIPIRPGKSPPGAVPPSPVQTRMLRFSKEKIAELKEKANVANPKQCSADKEISSLQALMAHLWVCITRSRGLRDDKAVHFLIAVGMRSRLQPPLSKSYVGNAVLNKVVKCTAGELLGHGMGWAARRINEEIAAHARMETREFFDYCLSPLDLGTDFLITGGSPRFDVYGNNFGWGRPLAHQSGRASRNGVLTVSPGSVEGSIEFEATLSPETFHALAGDPEFTHYST